LLGCVSEIQLELSPPVVVRQFLQSGEAGLEIFDRFRIRISVGILSASTRAIFYGLRRVGTARVMMCKICDVVLDPGRV